MRCLARGRPRAASRRRRRLDRAQGRRAGDPCARASSSACRRGSSPPTRSLAETPRLSEPVRRSCSARPAAGAWPRARRWPRPARRRRWSCRSSARARATCAIARAPAHHRSRRRSAAPRGRLAIVGIGPGDAGWPHRRSRGRASRAADDLVGYRALSRSARAARRRQDAARLRARRRRRRACAHALDLAAAGRQRGADLLRRCRHLRHGQPGVRADRARARGRTGRASRSSALPGVSAMQAAAARLGAPLGHDFCAISLSDLLTPWPVIEQRLEAAAAGDFVVALYNPVSQRRRTQLAERARASCCDRAPPETPVVIARNLGRAGETRARSRRWRRSIPTAVDMLIARARRQQHDAARRAARRRRLGLHAARLCGSEAREDDAA